MVWRFLGCNQGKDFQWLNTEAVDYRVEYFRFGLVFLLENWEEIKVDLLGFPIKEKKPSIRKTMSMQMQDNATICIKQYRLFYVLYHHNHRNFYYSTEEK